MPTPNERFVVENLINGVWLAVISCGNAGRADWYCGRWAKANPEIQYRVVSKTSEETPDD